MRIVLFHGFRMHHPMAAFSLFLSNQARLSHESPKVPKSQGVGLIYTIIDYQCVTSFSSFYIGLGLLGLWDFQAFQQKSSIT